MSTTTTLNPSHAATATNRPKHNLTSDIHSSENPGIERRPNVNHGRKTRAVAVLVAFSAILGALVLGAAPAGAATAEWRMFDSNGDRWNETAIYFDVAGRPTHVFMDNDRSGRYEIFILLDSTGPRYIWFDTNGNGTFDTVALYQNGSARAWLGNPDEVGGWDWLVDPVTGGTWSGQTSCRGCHIDPLFGLSWASWVVPVSTSSSGAGLLTGIIGSPSFNGNIFITVAKLPELANANGALHCYNYPQSPGCYDEQNRY